MPRRMTMAPATSPEFRPGSPSRGPESGARPHPAVFVDAAPGLDLGMPRDEVIESS